MSLSVNDSVNDLVNLCSSFNVSFFSSFTGVPFLLNAGCKAKLKNDTKQIFKQ